MGTNIQSQSLNRIMKLYNNAYDYTLYAKIYTILL